jgi:hypothetical protein
MPDKASQGESTVKLGEGVRSIVSLLIFIHLFCVALALLGNESASVLTDRLTGVLGSYTRMLNLDPEFTAGYHLTHAAEYEDDHQLVIEVDGQAEPTLYPAPGQSWSWCPLGFRQHRWRMLAQRLGVLATEGNDEAIAELARAIGEAVFAQSDVTHLVLRCRRLRPSELNSAVDHSIEDQATYEMLYSADVLRDQRGNVRVHKQIEADEVAPVRGA